MLPDQSVIASHSSLDSEAVVPQGWDSMSISKNVALHAALSRDLKKLGSKEIVRILNDSTRKVFTTNRDGAVFVFPHKQRDPAFWIGMKHYGSGPTSRVRIRRAQIAIDSQ